VIAPTMEVSGWACISSLESNCWQVADPPGKQTARVTRLAHVIGSKSDKRGSVSPGWPAEPYILGVQCRSKPLHK
jgi:hypothetical protein